MKIKKIAAATLGPAVIAGVTLSSWAAVHAATSYPGPRAVARQAHRAHPAPSAEQHKAGPAKQAKKARTASVGHHRAGHGAHAPVGHRALAKAAASTQPAVSSSSSLLSGMSAFEQCVAYRESGDNPTASSAGLFGILPATWASLGYPGTAGQASVTMQKAAFDRLYAQYGTSPWAPYDGC